MKKNEDAYIKNTVSAMDQVKERSYKTNKPNAKLNILFFGNSITLHEYKPEIGWLNNHGMAASCKENDYVHQVIKKIEEKYGDVSYCIINVGMYEMNPSDTSLLDVFEQYLDFKPDIIVFRFGENYSKSNFDEKLYRDSVYKFFEKFKKKDNFGIVTDEFWEYEPMDNILKDVAKDYECKFVSICDLGYEDKYKAIGKFAHQGVANHPGDLGMKIIAERIFNVLENEYLKNKRL